MIYFMHINKFSLKWKHVNKELKFYNYDNSLNGLNIIFKSI